MVDSGVMTPNMEKKSTWLRVQGMDVTKESHSFHRVYVSHGTLQKLRWKEGHIVQLSTTNTELKKVFLR